MPESPTPKLGLYKPLANGSEFYNLVTDLLNNWDKIDAAMGATAVTSSTRPASAYNGQLIRETDTGRVYVSNGTLPGSASFTTQLVVATQKVLAASASRILRMTMAGDTDDRWFLDNNGTTWWGGGSAVDTNLYRVAANTLQTDDSFVVIGNLTVLGIGQHTTLVRVSDATFTSNTTLANDPTLQFSMAASAQYYVRIVAAVGGTVGDFKSSWSVPASATGIKMCHGPTAGSTTPFDTNMLGTTHPFSVPVAYGLNDTTTPSRIVEEGIVITVGAGTFNWQRAQNTSSASTTTLFTGSFMQVERIA